MERLSTADCEQGALRNLVDGWFYCLEEDALADGGLDAKDSEALAQATERLLEKRLAEITRTNPAFAAGLRGYRQAQLRNDSPAAEGLIAWLAGQPNVAAGVKRDSGIKGDIDHFGALSCLQGLLVVLRDSGKPGLLVVLDEVETLQRVRGDVREKSLNALRQLIDEIDSGRFPGLYLLVTGTPAFFDGMQGVQRLPPLAQRLHVDFTTDARFDNPRAVQLRLSPFDLHRLIDVGRRIRDIYAEGSGKPAQILSVVDDRYVEDLAKAVTGGLGGKVGVAPRIFLKKLVGDVLDRVDQFPEFDPRLHYQLTIAAGEMDERERRANSPDEIDLDL
jgi:hypothetical protein